MKIYVDTASRTLTDAGGTPLGIPDMLTFFEGTREILNVTFQESGEPFVLYEGDTFKVNLDNNFVHTDNLMAQSTDVEVTDGEAGGATIHIDFRSVSFGQKLDGKEKISGLMEKLRADEPETIAGSRVVNIRDYLAETSKNTLTGEVSGTGLPKSNVLYWATENGNVVVARPSGTEPKIKFYILANGADEESAAANAKACTHSLEDMLGMPHDSLKK